MKYKIIIIEDDKEIMDSLIYLFEKNEFSVIPFSSAEQYFLSNNKLEFCVHLVDWDLPGIKGTNVVRFIREKYQLATIFMITGYSSVGERIEGLNCGADDYITKPFDYEELLARVKNAQAKLISIKRNLMKEGIHLMPEARSIVRDGVIIGLTTREFAILSYLFQNQQLDCTREEIISNFENDSTLTTRNIDVHVFSLRKKIKSININVKTIWGSGYRMIVLDCKSDH